MFFILVGLGLIGLIIFMPQLFRLRIRLLRWMGLETLAQFLEKRSDGLVLFFRLLAAAIAVTLFVAASAT